MRIAVDKGLIAEILDEAARTPAVEVCGLLFGDDTRIAAARATVNVADDPATTFEIDPRALFAALRAERAGGDRVIGHYHSHPNGNAFPSARDAAAAAPGSLWLIAGGGVVRAWRALTDGDFAEVTLVADGCAAATQSPQGRA